MFICACGCGTHVYSTCTGPGHGLRAGACLLHFACVRAVRCSAWIVQAVVYLECVCVCVRQSVCVARLVSLVQRFVCQRGSRALCILARVGTSCWYLFVQCFAQRGSRAQSYSPVLVPRSGTSFVQCFAWSAKRGQMCLVCPTPCAVRLGITGAENTRPCWYLCWYLFRKVLRLVSPGNASLARARTHTVPSLPYPLRSSRGYHGR